MVLSYAGIQPCRFSTIARADTRNLIRLRPFILATSGRGSLAQLRIRSDGLAQNTRKVGLRFALLTLRLMEHWRCHLGLDADSALIVLATLSVTMEKFTRSEIEFGLRDVRTTVPSDRLTRCNVSGIAEATGLNRETARRKVNSLVEAGILLRDANGGLRVSSEYTRKVPTTELLQCHLETLVYASNEFLREKVIVPAVR